MGEIQRFVTHLKKRGIALLITDHNVRETLGICDRAYILAEGHRAAQGSRSDPGPNADVRRVLPWGLLQAVTAGAGSLSFRSAQA